MLLPIHIVAGALAISVGAVALLAAKGRTLHRRSGLMFVCVMLIMGISGSVLAARKSLTDISVLGGFMSAYFVVTAFTTVRAASPWTRRLNGLALMTGLGVACVWIGLGLRGLINPRPGVQPFMIATAFFLGGAILLAVLGDVRMIRGQVVSPRARLARHLWRMCFALFIAVGSFVAVPERVAKILPDLLATPPMRAVPLVLVFVVLFYWLWRIRGSRLSCVSRSHA
jgi:uncharacterized membrane protein